ncbi:MAG TPA: sigma-54 dependent transcriptional regulator [Oligoflexia bacterium]|nr:sigma-54 dependent transcriptional regulator [Oligoflexia bacterium]HMP47578.1 sigma-54 dependent transcriptional regulator [Oligoflexia bacterium]
MTEDRIEVLVVDDEMQMRSAMESTLARLGATVFTAENGHEALSLLEKKPFDLIISDMRMPVCNGEELLKAVSKKYNQIPMVMVTAYGTINQAVEVMRLGAFDFLTKPFSMEDLEHLLDRIKGRSNNSIVTSQSSEARKPNKDSVAIITQDSVMKELIQTVTHIASSSASVLIQGESGTGKELIARLLHASNTTIAGPFVAVNCAALPENLLESELFGHEKGAFTGALATRIGKFEQANGGTLLLDEVTEMPLSLQAKLLRVLQEREVDRIGGSKPISVQVRIVATTNRDAREIVLKGDFREDLYYRLNVIPVYIPSLRERPGDIKPLVEYFLRKFSGDKISDIPDSLLDVLQNYRWPGNIRELQNACERAALMCKDGKLSLQHFMLAEGAQGKSRNNSFQSELKAGLSVADAERMLIYETLRATENNKTKAAELLGISIRTLRNKLNEYGENSDELSPVS